MFVGHLAVALGVKRARRNAPLAWLVGGTFALDLLWPLFLLAGVERVRVEPGATAFTPLAFDYYPWTHSLVMAIAWGLLLGMLATRRFHDRVIGFLVGAIVPSHWLLDWLTHRPDLPLWPGGPLWGLGLWNSIPATLIVEGALFLVAVDMYRRAFPARDATGRWAFRALIGLATLIWITSPWSPPPPNVTAIAGAGIALWLFPVWAGAIERHRVD